LRQKERLETVNESRLALEVLIWIPKEKKSFSERRAEAKGISRILKRKEIDRSEVASRLGKEKRKFNRRLTDCKNLE